MSGLILKNPQDILRLFPTIVRPDTNNALGRSLTDCQPCGRRISGGSSAVLLERLDDYAIPLVTIESLDRALGVRVAELMPD